MPRKSRKDLIYQNTQSILKFDFEMCTVIVHRSEALLDYDRSGRTMADYNLHEICALKGKCITVFDVRFNPFSLEAIFLSLKMYPIFRNDDYRFLYALTKCNARVDRKI